MQLPCAGVTFRFTAIPHCYCKVGAISCIDFFFCLHMLTKLSSSDSIFYNQCRWHCTWSIFHYSKITSPQNFLFICLSFPALCVCSCKKLSLYLFFFSLCLHCVWCELPHSLGTQAVMFVRLIHSSLCSPVQNYLISVLITEAQFDFWDLMFTQIFCFAPMISIKHFPEMAEESLLQVTLSEFP